jgi:hypothetical protein
MTFNKSPARIQDAVATVAAMRPPIHTYFDKVRIWLRRPLNKGRAGQLRHGDHRVTDGCWFRCFQQQVELYHPTRETLHDLAAWLDGDDDVLINYVEVACDLILPEFMATALDTLFKRGFLQPWHGAMVPHNYPHSFTTRRIGKGSKRAGRWFQAYADRPCKLTGEVGCFHAEFKHQGVRSVRSLGIRHPRDCLAFDFDAYFSKWMVLYDLDCERLGRFDHNRRSGAKRKKPRIGGSARHPYNNDQGRGEGLYYVLSMHPTSTDHSLQHFVDQYGRGPFLTPLLFYVHVAECITSSEVIAASTFPSPFTLKSPSSTTITLNGSSSSLDLPRTRITNTRQRDRDTRIV